MASILPSKNTNKSVVRIVKAIHTYQADDETELSICPGDTITVYKSEWWYGSITSSDGTIRTGFFPSNFVEVVKEYPLISCKDNKKLDECKMEMSELETTTNHISLYESTKLSTEIEKTVDSLDSQLRDITIAVSKGSSKDLPLPEDENITTTYNKHQLMTLKRKQHCFNEAISRDIYPQGQESLPHSETKFNTIRRNSIHRATSLPSIQLRNSELVFNNNSKKSVKVLYTYNAETDQELLLYPGEEIEILRLETNSSWCLGRNGRNEIGIFNLHLTDFFDSGNTTSSLNDVKKKWSSNNINDDKSFSRDVIKKQYVKAIYNYKAQDGDEINLRSGEEIEILGSTEDEGWLRGKNYREEIGTFPSNFCGSPYFKEELRDKNDSNCRAPNTRNCKDDKKMFVKNEVVKVLRNYDAVASNEISLTEGEEIQIIDSTYQEGWYLGKSWTGDIGLFPSNFTTRPYMKSGEEFVKPTMSRPASPTSIPDSGYFSLEGNKPNNSKLVKVYYYYKPTSNDEIALFPGEEIEIIKENVHTGWHMGKTIRQEIGLFPCNFVSPPYNKP